MHFRTHFALFLVLSGLYFLHSASALAQDDSATILCHDLERGIVQRVMRGRCNGEEVTAKQAEAIHMQERRRRAGRISTIENKTQTEQKKNRRSGMRYGTAFPIDDAGHFLTARHVVTDCKTLALDDHEGNRFKAEEMARHKDADIALLYASELTVAAFSAAQDEPDYDDPLYTIGYPQEGLPRIRPAHLDGTMQGMSNEDSPIRYLAFRAGVRSGNSGGPLFNAQGALVGMVIAKVNTVAVFEVSGTIVRDVGFAIAHQSLDSFLDEQGLSLKKMTTDTLPADPAELEKSVMRVVCTP